MAALSNLNLANRDRGIWLVKVPKYISDKWDQAPGHVEVAKLRISQQSKQPLEVTLMLSEATLALKKPDEQQLPKHHKLAVRTVTQQSCAIFSEVSTPHGAASSAKSESSEQLLYMEGRIKQKFECRPKADDAYMKLTLQRIKKASIRKTVVQLKTPVNSFKPVSNHKSNIEYEEKKKAEGKKLRAEKSVVQEALFKAFEKHQYYNIKDLVNITKQPVVYLKEILNEICNYNLKNPHRNMWELKPEYRHYNDKDKQ